jgi:hypothetical protein
MAKTLRMLAGTPKEFRGDARYAFNKAVRDQAWDDWRATHRVSLRDSMPPELIALLDEGYDYRLATGDLRAASLFTRKLADRLNPSRHGSLPGALTKGGGNNVDGYSVDALVLNNNPNDLFNVIDCVRGAEAPGAAATWNGPLPRRPSDRWEAPRAMTVAEDTYLLGRTPEPKPGPAPGPDPKPTPVVLPPYEAIGGDQIFRDWVGIPLQADMAAAGQPLNDGSAVWFSRTIDSAYRAILASAQANPQAMVVAAARRHRNEWRAILGLPPL